jgi:trigger factor
MQVSLETTQGLERRLSISIAAEAIQTEVKNAIRDIAKNERMPGFRPGKVPTSVIQKRYGAAVEQDVKEKLMQRNFFEAMVQEKINPAGAPTLAAGETVDGQFNFTATFEVFPEVALNDLSAIAVEKKVCEVADSDVDAMIETLRKQQAAWNGSDAAIEGEDRVNIDFVGKIDGEEFEGGKAEGFSLTMGSSRMIPGFEDDILGKKAGDEFTIEVNFPEDYHAENLKGKAASFDIKVNKVEKPELPELTADFVKKFGVETGEVEGLKAEIRKNMDRELDQNLKADIKERVLTALLEGNQLEVPKALIEQEIGQLREQAMQRFGNAKGVNMPELPNELFADQAERRVKIGLLLGEVIKANELKVDDERVQAQIAQMASAYEDPSEVVAYYAKNEELMGNVRNVIIEEQAIDFILGKASVTEVKAQFADIMNK